MNVTDDLRLDDLVILLEEIGSLLFHVKVSQKATECKAIDLFSKGGGDCSRLLHRFAVRVQQSFMIYLLSVELPKKASIS